MAKRLNLALMLFFLAYILHRLDWKCSRHIICTAYRSAICSINTAASWQLDLPSALSLSLARTHARVWTDGGMNVTYCRRYIVNGDITMTINFSCVAKPPRSPWITVSQRQQKTQQYQHLCESVAATTAGATLLVNLAQAVETVRSEFSTCQLSNFHQSWCQRTVSRTRQNHW